MKIIILAGGSGTRLWPLSRQDYPKQFLKLRGDKSLLHATADRFLNVVKYDDIIVITNKKYEFLVRSDLPWLKHIILEPIGRNTAPAIALAAKYCTEKMCCREREVMLISPSDHIIEPVDKFEEYIKLSDKIAKTGRIVTFGIKPEKPETGYGYIKANLLKPLDDAYSAYDVERFVEKPDLETAKEYLADGSYYWNSGMFAFTLATIRSELLELAPEIGKFIDKSFDKVLDSFQNMPSISIDYAIMEKSANVTVIPAKLKWNDIGSWDSLFDGEHEEKNQGKIDDNLISIASKNTVVIGSTRVIAIVGLEDCMIVDTDDALLVAKKGSGQKVKDVMELLVSSGRKEALEHNAVQRPWGSFTTFLSEKGFKVKKIVVNAGQKLSLQFHTRRTEHWTVVKGKARITIGDITGLYNENESLYIPASVWHRLENPGRAPLEIIEIQYGGYLGEDDIVRVEDAYGRCSSSSTLNSQVSSS